MCSTPTIMDWHKVPLPSYAILKKSISFTGRSQLSLPSNFQLVTNSWQHFAQMRSLFLPFLLLKVSKSQKIFFLVFNTSKKWTKTFSISALASKKWSNKKKIKYSIVLNKVCTFIFLFDHFLEFRAKIENLVLFLKEVKARKKSFRFIDL